MPCRQRWHRLPWQIHSVLSMGYDIATAMQAPQSTQVQRLSLRLRSFRQFHGSTPLGQERLAALAGVPVRQLHKLETLRSIPYQLRVLLQLAGALDCSLDDLVVRHTNEPSAVVVALRRSHGSVALCADHTGILEVRHQACRRRSACGIATTAVRLATDHGAMRLLTDRASKLAPEYAAFEEVDLEVVAAALGVASGKQATLAAYALTELPHLRRFVHLQAATGRPSVEDRRGILVLLAATVALAIYAKQQHHDFLQLELPFQD